MVLFIFLTINLFGVFSFCEFSEFMGVSHSDFQIKVKKYLGNCNDEFLKIMLELFYFILFFKVPCF
jgi:hypothetical protein